MSVVHPARQGRAATAAAIAVLLSMPGSPGAAAGSAGYPDTRILPVADTLDGTVVIDNYRWLEDGSDTSVREWTNAQNRLARSFLDTLPQRRYLLSRLAALRRYDRQGMPFRVPDGNARFHWRRAADQEKPVSYVQEHDSLPARVIVDENELELEERLLSFSPSRDGRYVALGFARSGSEDARIRIMETANGEFLPDTLRGARQSWVSWVPGNTGFYYTAAPRPGTVPAGDEAYWYTVYFHRLGDPADRDEKVFGHDSVREYYHICQVSDDGRCAGFVRASMARVNELFLQRLDPPGPMLPVATGFDATYGGAVVDSSLLIMTDSGAPMGMVYVTSPERPGRENWREFVPEIPDARLVNIATIGGRIYLVYERKAHTVVRIHDPDAGFLREMRLPAIGTASVDGSWLVDEVRVSFSSFAYPGSQFYYNFAADSLELFFQPELDIEPDRYVTELVWYESLDSTRVSMFLTRPKHAPRDGSTPVLLTAYGGFGVSMTPGYSSSHMAWLESGGMLAVVHVRGGGEQGRQWHEAGKLAGRQKTFEDLIAAAEWLVAEKYTRPELLAAYGGSNGGLTVAAAIVQRPELFRAVVLDRPILDMLRYHLFGPAGMWAGEYGTAEDPDQFRYIAGYSPYANVKPGTDYPALLLFGSENDFRADPCHVRKMAARMQAANPDGRPVLLLVESASGHFGGTTETVQIEQSADRYAFLMSALNMRP
ncbi:MAG: S9 family peptidase [candidate division WOR-3 bacterium]|nr:MAG: S9 family peptidase [candidate division WOR-3 bacterium]